MIVSHSKYFSCHLTQCVKLQILNQPLAPQTLQLLNQLLNQIKLQHSLVQQQTLISLQPLTKQQSQNHLQISVQITKTKQTIANLQNQIAAQQALFVKQQSMNSGGGPQADFFPKPQMNDPTMPLDVGLGHLSMKEPQSQVIIKNLLNHVVTFCLTFTLRVAAISSQPVDQTRQRQ